MIARLPILMIEAHSRCNCRCLMCDIWKTSEHREFTPAQLEAQIPSMEALGVRWVVFTGGEPLMHSNLFALAEPLRTRGIRVSILSTGLLFERFAGEIAVHVDDAIVSLDGPAAIHDHIRRVPGGFDQIAQGIRAIHARRPEFPVTARCVVQKANHRSLRAAAVAARGIGVKSISFLAADLTSSAFNRAAPWNSERQAGVALAPQHLAPLEAEIAALEQDPFVADSPAHLRRIVKHFRAHLGLEPPEAPSCNAPWVSGVLTLDGAVKPCFFHPPIGSGELQAAVNSAEALAFREQLHVADDPICRRCVCSLHLVEMGNA